MRNSLSLSQSLSHPRKIFNKDIEIEQHNNNFEIIAIYTKCLKNTHLSEAQLEYIQKNDPDLGKKPGLNKLQRISSIYTYV